MSRFILGSLMVFSFLVSAYSVYADGSEKFVIDSVKNRSSMSVKEVFQKNAYGKPVKNKVTVLPTRSPTGDTLLIYAKKDQAAVRRALYDTRLFHNMSVELTREQLEKLKGKPVTLGEHHSLIYRNSVEYFEHGRTAAAQKLMKKHLDKKARIVAVSGDSVLFKGANRSLAGVFSRFNFRSLASATFPARIAVLAATAAPIAAKAGESVTLDSSTEQTSVVAAP